MCLHQEVFNFLYLQWILTIKLASAKMKEGGGKKVVDVYAEVGLKNPYR